MLQPYTVGIKDGDQIAQRQQDYLRSDADRHMRIYRRMRRHGELSAAFAGPRGNGEQ